MTAGGARVAGVGLLTGWGAGLDALPDDAQAAAGDRAVLALPRPAVDGARFRRATRECVLGVAAVEATLTDAGLGRDAIRGSATALLFVTAGAYGASNVEFVGGRKSTLHFPYTAPSALSGEVAIEFGLTGAYVILIGGAPATIDALWQASRLLAEGRCERALVLVVETFEECEALWRRARWTLPRPLVESAAGALLVPGDRPAAYRAAAAPGALETVVEQRAGRTLAAAPLIALGLARGSDVDVAVVTGTWRGRTAGITLAVAGPGRESDEAGGPWKSRKSSTS